MEINYKGGTYIGDLLHGVPHGKGKFTCYDYDYEGDFVNGKFHGWGKLDTQESWSDEPETYMYNSKGERIFSDGDTYEGEFLDGIPNGKGKGTFIEDKHGIPYFYDGEILDARPHGQGKCKFYHDLGFYEGSWINGKANGQSKRILEDGSVYEGIWVDDILFNENGYITLTLDVYTGGLEDGLPHGEGVLIERFSEYEGGFKHGKYSGYGKLRSDFKNGVTIRHTYEGNFLDGKFHGQGFYTERDGHLTYKGDFKDGEYHGEGKEICPEADIYEGGWHKGSRHGFGRLIMKHGSVVEGEWNRRELQCIGKITLADGQVFHGRFVPHIGYLSNQALVVKGWHRHKDRLVCTGCYGIEGIVELNDSNMRDLHTFHLETVSAV